MLQQNQSINPKGNCSVVSTETYGHASLLGMVDLAVSIDCIASNPGFMT